MQFSTLAILSVALSAQAALGQSVTTTVSALCGDACVSASHSSNDLVTRSDVPVSMRTDLPTFTTSAVSTTMMPAQFTGQAGRGMAVDGGLALMGAVAYIML